MSESLDRRLALANRASSLTDLSMDFKIRAWEMVSNLAAEEDNLEVFEKAETVIAIYKSLL